MQEKNIQKESTLSKDEGNQKSWESFGAILIGVPFGFAFFEVVPVLYFVIETGNGMNEIVQSGKYAFDIFRMKILFSLSIATIVFVVSLIKAISDKKCGYVLGLCAMLMVSVLCFCFFLWN